MDDSLTFEEKLLLRRLAEGPQDDRDGISERVLVGKGFATRIDFGMIQITSAGRAHETA